MEITKLSFLFAVIAFSACVHNGFALYFVQVEHTVSRDFFIGNGWMAEAVLDPDDSGSVIYSIVPKTMACPNLAIDTTNGNVTFEVQPHQGQSSFVFDKPCVYRVSAKLQGQLGHRNSSKTSMNLTISTDHTDCLMASNEYKCFGGLKNITVEVLENNKAKVKLAQFGKDMTRCGKSGLQYNVVIGEDFDVVSIEKNTQDEAYELWAKAGLDREYKEAYEFKVQCTWMPQNGVKHESTSISGRMTILDEDDNGPKTQDLTTHEVYDISFEPNGKNLYKPDAQVRPANVSALLVIDKDTVAVNRFQFTVVNDTWNLLRLHPNPFPTSHTPTETALLLRIFLTNEASTRKPWTGRYCVKAILNDTTLISRSGDSSTMVYLICLHWGEPHVHAHGDNPRPTKSTVTTLSSVPHEEVCGKTCKFYISVTGAVCLITICGLCVCWRLRWRETKRRKCPVVKPGGLLEHGLIHGEDYSDNGNNVNTEDYMAPNNGNALAVNSLHDPDLYMLLDPKWEIPRSDLMLEQILGEGEFGKVLKGRLRGLSSPEGYINVAVKMLKDNHMESGKSSRQEFMAEFVLLKQVDHPNVIKLIGACTAAGGPLYLVMEYAELGSLRSFLRKCRQIESLGEGGDQALDASNYIVSPKEVIGFSWQIAKGMTYLSDMKMVHRDLAARNILVTQNKVCKISDFGLTRDIYVDDAYKKKSKDRVPVKWLAPECLADELYTTKSDVWSYGILLWELATLGASPYPGIPSEQVYSWLKSGYRMEQPPNCSFELYCLMRNCWAAEPINRPSFREIDMTLSKLLEDGIEYLQLDVPWVSNPGYQYFNDTQTVVLPTPEIPGVRTSATDAPLMSTFLPANRTAEVAPRMSYDNINPPYINYEGVENPEAQEVPECHARSPDMSHSHVVYDSPKKNGAAVAVQD